MLKAIFSGVSGRGKAVVLVVLALMVVTSGTAMAVTYTKSKRASLKLNKPNYVATALTKLVSNAVGPALTLETDSTDPNATPLKLDTETSSQAPMSVDSSTKVTNLNADSLDDMDSTEFAPSAVEPWHEVGQTGEPAFQNGWQNLGDTRTATAAFYKDPWGVVHLKGTVKSGSNGSTIFILPCGYGPDKDQNFTVVSPGANTANVGILDVAFLTPACGDGSYRAEVRAAQSSATAFSLNDVTFRAHGS